MVILASEMTFIRKESFLNVEIQRQIIHDKMPESFQTTLRRNSSTSTLPTKTEFPIR